MSERVPANTKYVHPLDSERINFYHSDAARLTLLLLSFKPFVRLPVFPRRGVQNYDDVSSRVDQEHGLPALILRSVQRGPP